MRTIVRAISWALVALLLVAGLLALREYLLLRNLKKVISSPPISSTTPLAAERQSETQIPLVSNIRRTAGGAVIHAQVDFPAVRRMVEKSPAVVNTWGTVAWKVVNDTPALCLRKIPAESPLRQLSAKPGDCIIELDGQTVNQPMRNLGIWLTLPARKELRIKTWRGNSEISYILRR